MKMTTKKHFAKKILLLKCYENETKYIKGELKNLMFQFKINFFDAWLRVCSFQKKVAFRAQSHSIYYFPVRYASISKNFYIRT